MRGQHADWCSTAHKSVTRHHAKFAVVSRKGDIISCGRSVRAAARQLSSPRRLGISTEHDRTALPCSNTAVTVLSNQSKQVALTTRASYSAVSPGARNFSPQPSAMSSVPHTTSNVSQVNHVSGPVPAHLHIQPPASAAAAFTALALSSPKANHLLPSVTSPTRHSIHGQMPSHEPGTPHHQHSYSSTTLTGAAAASDMQPAPQHQPALVIFSGGTAFNSVAGHLRALTTRVTHVLPVSDDGGSTAEVVRVLGGPAVGDIRSRCLRLADSSDTEAKAVKGLLAHRLPAGDPDLAKKEWYDVVEGSHLLWQGVSKPYMHVIRSFLVHFHHQILASAATDERFDFRNGSIGNFFFAGARTFFRSLEAAIFLYSRVARIPEGCTVIPAICTEERITLGAELEDGSVIRGQNNISHPPAQGAHVSEVVKTCHHQPPLPSPIRRVFYLSSSSHFASAASQADDASLDVTLSSPLGAATPVGFNPASSSVAGVGSSGSVLLPHPGLAGGVELEVLPQAHPTALFEVGRADAIVYGMGSLYTSICPTICLEGMGEAVAARNVHKILILNGNHDRETSCSGAHEGPMTAADVVQAVCDALNRRRNRQGSRLVHTPSTYVTGLLSPMGGEVEVDRQALQVLGVRYVLEVRSKLDNVGHVLYEPSDLVEKIADMLKLPLPLPQTLGVSSTPTQL